MGHFNPTAPCLPCRANFLCRPVTIRSAVATSPTSADVQLVLPKAGTAPKYTAQLCPASGSGACVKAPCNAKGLCSVDGLAAGVTYKATASAAQVASVASSSAPASNTVELATPADPVAKLTAADTSDTTASATAVPAAGCRYSKVSRLMR